VAKPKRAVPRGKPKAKPEPKLTRVAFRVSRLMEFCSERELENQTGHAVYEWPLVVAKEGMDNALDAAEEAEVAPEIKVVVDQDSIVICGRPLGKDCDGVICLVSFGHMSGLT
jgi:hypothetical protein